jgi:hypothetical protein
VILRGNMSASVQPVPDTDEWWQATQKAASSVTFQRSPRLRELLVYICDRAIHNRPEDLREQQIGCAIFGRKPDYSPGEDNIVRVEMRQLRKRLDEYFATEGKDEPYTILIPKGNYVPVFERRESPPAPAALVNPDPVVVRPGSRRYRDFAQVAVMLALAALCAWFWRESRVAAQKEGASVTAADRAPLWKALFNDDQPTQIVCADSGLVVAESMLHRSVTLDQYFSRNYVQKSDNLGSFRALVESAAQWQFTDITDVRLVQRLHGLNAGHWNKVSIRSARTTQIQDFKSGNSILLGSVRSNLWNKLFEPLLNFQFDFDEQTRTPFIRNKAPRAGEESVYRAARLGESGQTYSIVALVPNLRHAGSVLIVAGTSGEGTEAAGEFIMNADTAGQLMKTLGTSWNASRLPYFEVLLRSGALAGIAKNAEIVSARILPGEIGRD